MSVTKTKEQALRDLGRVVADAVAIASRLTVREAAERVWRADGPPMDVLMKRIAATGICRSEAVAS